jgi:hypothetical protein
MNHALPVTLLASLVMPPPVTAQTKPDFSGRWVMDAARSESSVQDEPVRAMTVVIRQLPTEIKIETTRDDRHGDLG